MEASGLTHQERVPALAGFAPHLRLQSDERLVALVRRGHHGAFEALVRRYQPRLLAFSRHMLGSKEDAEDVLQESLASAYRAIRADERAIRLRPWLYRIVRNRCLNHLGRPRPVVGDPEAVLEGEATPTAAETVDRREELRAVVADVRELPESQRTALLLRQVDSLSYEQVAEAMETTVPSVKSLLVRARVSLAEGAEARRLTCAEVRLELGQAAERIAKPSAPARRHARHCPRCRAFKRDLRTTGTALAALHPVGAVVALKQLVAGKLGAGTAAAAGGGGAIGGGGAAAVTAGTASIATKTAAGLLAAGAVAVGTTQVDAGPPGKPVAGGQAVTEAGGAVARHAPGGAGARGEARREGGQGHARGRGAGGHRRHEPRRAGGARRSAGDADRAEPNAAALAAGATPGLADGGEPRERPGARDATPADPAAPPAAEPVPAGAPADNAAGAGAQGGPGGGSGTGEGEQASGSPEPTAGEETRNDAESSEGSTPTDPKGTKGTG